MTALDAPPIDPPPPAGSGTEGRQTGGDAAAARPSSTGRLGYQPSIDGLHALAVTGVLLFHGGVPWAQGGFLGVSTFFTLSGFLITTLLLTERERDRHIDLRRFWSRRFRRLMPAALLCLAGVVLFGATVATADQLQSLRGDALAALFYVANWHFIVVDQSYGDLFTDPSPVQHFWSLAIEEQFYLVFPLLTAGVLRAGRGSRLVLGGVFAVLTLGSVLLTISLYHPGLDPIRVYYGTFTRAAELLIGALLAVLVAGRGPVRQWWNRQVIVVVGVLGLGLTLYWWTTVDLRTPWLFEGGLAIYALASAAVVLAAINDTPVRRVLGVVPLVMLGRISYGVYLFHWPIFLWLSPRRTGLSLWPLFSLRVAVTLVVSIASYHLLEMPVRERRWPTGPHMMLVAPVAVTCIVIGILGVTWDPPAPALDFTAVTTGTIPEAPERTAEQAAAVDPRTVERVLLMGDSVMQQAYGAVEERLVADGVQVGYAGGPGSGPLFPQDDWSNEMADWLGRFEPDVVVIEACCDYTDFADELYHLPDGTEVRPDTDAMFDAWDQESRRLITQARQGGAVVLWVMPPPVQTNGFYGPLESHVQRLREIYQNYDEIPGVRLVRWDSAVAPGGDFTWDAEGPGGEAARVRADDGVHMTQFGNSLLAGTTIEAVFASGRHPPLEQPLGGERPPSEAPATSVPAG